MDPESTWFWKPPLTEKVEGALAHAHPEMSSIMPLKYELEDRRGGKPQLQGQGEAVSSINSPIPFIAECFSQHERGCPGGLG